MADIEEYERLAHAMQTGVAMKMNYEPKEVHPKHLRVGINSAHVSQAALVRVLVQKGLLTNEEYSDSVTEEMRREVDRYKTWLTEYLATDIELI